MYCCLGTVKECIALRGKLPERVCSEVLRGVAVLDSIFGETRDYFISGGFSLIATTASDLQRARQIFNDQLHSCEWSTVLGDSGYVSALYLLDNERSVMLYVPMSLANDDILENLGG